MTEHKRVYANDNGVRRTLVIDDERPDQVGVFTEQNLDEILEGISRDRELHSERTTNKLLARIPITVYELAVNQKWDEGDWRRWLNSFEAAPFRVWSGRV